MLPTKPRSDVFRLLGVQATVLKSHIMSGIGRRKTWYLYVTAAFSRPRCFRLAARLVCRSDLQRPAAYRRGQFGHQFFLQSFVFIDMMQGIPLPQFLVE